MKAIFIIVVAALLSIGYVWWLAAMDYAIDHRTLDTRDWTCTQRPAKIVCTQWTMNPTDGLGAPPK